MRKTRKIVRRKRENKQIKRDRGNFNKEEKMGENPLKTDESIKDEKCGRIEKLIEKTTRERASIRWKKK